MRNRAKFSSVFDEFVHLAWRGGDWERVEQRAFVYDTVHCTDLPKVKAFHEEGSLTAYCAV
jgi:hypothetical protein